MPPNLPPFIIFALSIKLSEMANTSFSLKTPKKDESLIYLIVTFNRNRLKFSTKEKVNVKYWDKKKQRVKSILNYPYKEINSRLNIIEDDTLNIIEKSKPIVAGILKEKISKYLNKKDTTPIELLPFFNNFTSNLKQRINIRGKKISNGTITSYKRTYDLLKDFDENVRKIDFDNIDLEFYEKFTSYLKSTCKFAPNTIGKHIKNLKTVLNTATERGINKNLKFKKSAFKVIKEDTDQIYLNEKELQLLIDLDLTNNERLEKARDLFILSCYLGGLRYSDYSKLTKDDIIINEGREMFKIRSQKTDNDVIIPILPQAKNIIDKYDEIPVLSNQKLNEYIKEVCKLVPLLNEKVIQTSTENDLQVSKKIEKYKLVSTRTARKSFATNMYRRGIPIQTIMAITGHKTEKVFLKYVRASQTERVLDFVRAFENSNELKIVNNEK